MITTTSTSIDLVYIDQQTRTIYHVEVKTVTGDRIPITPEDNLTNRFNDWVAQASTGVLNKQQLPGDMQALANRIGQAQDEGYAVSHNVMQVRIPRPGATGSVTAGLLPWPPAP
ncbi:hypothetical protein [Burkholderia sp. IMCC1007]|uniref:hypothetical protein n=1 Tax=Burkholderia sp. IMCC1007 TaxID=3004104 RepID=UPI0022B31885|nr:hypothetical protein [Burkholderia sp. IMCC1007]